MKEYFTIDELSCPCCGECHIDDGFLRQLIAARVLSDVPYSVNSAYRCPKHNKEVGSYSRNHVEGKAVDIWATNGYTRSRILTGLYLSGFRRIGIHGLYIHADSMDMPESTWLYQGT